MNLAHLHLALNHLPIIAVPLVNLFLVISVIRKNEDLKKISLIVLFFVGLTVLPVYFTGEPAEDFIDGYPSVTENVIHPHEEMAEKSLVLVLLTSGLAFATLACKQKPKWQKRLVYATIALSAISSMSLVYTAQLGGQIRHTEFR